MTDWGGISITHGSDSPQLAAFYKNAERSEVQANTPQLAAGKFIEIIEQWRHITLEKKCGIVVLDMKLLNTGLDRSLLDRLVAEIMLIALSYVAETEREMMRQRVVEGIAAAKARGVAVGRKPIQLPQNFDFIWDLWAQGELSGREAARQLGVDNHTFAKWAKELG